MKANFEIGLKYCSKCRRDLPLDNFHRSKGRSDGLTSYCKECSLKQNQEYRKNHSQHVRETMQKWNQSEHGIAMRKRDYNKRVALGIHKRYWGNKRKTDNLFRTALLLRQRLYLILKKNGGTKRNHTLDLLGCTVEELKTHLESQFQEGMIWENQGRGGWHIDHKIPCAYFDLSIEENQRICFNYRNLQPLWERDNIKKSDSVPENVEQLVEQLKKEIYANN